MEKGIFGSYDYRDHIINEIAPINLSIINEMIDSAKNDYGINENENPLIKIIPSDYLPDTIIFVVSFKDTDYYFVTNDCKNVVAGAKATSNNNNSTVSVTKLYVTPSCRKEKIAEGMIDIMELMYSGAELSIDMTPTGVLIMQDMDTLTLDSAELFETNIEIAKKLGYKIDGNFAKK